ncbi:MAG: ankyrin repeat domain-containing protein, partial [Novosphingobium sp.]|nr:ankyrin repeat domain-containing protein [Novosphingobium sp.]
IINNMGKTALIMATENNHKDIVELLLNNNADLDIPDNNGNTALKIAEENQYTDIKDMLKKED